MNRNIPIIAFFTRTSSWLLLIFMLVTNWAVLTQKIIYSWWTVNMEGYTIHETFTPFQLLGAVLYIPAISSVVIFVTLLIIHFRYRQTIDADIQNGNYLADWKALAPVDRIRMANLVFIGIIIGLCILCSSLARGGVPDQEARWNTARLDPHYSIALDVEVTRFQRLAGRYAKITAMRPNGVPTAIIYTLHQRESSGNFLCHPHEGSPLTQRTRFVPKGRLPKNSPPYTFEQSAEDAYYVCDRLDLVAWNKRPAALQGIESFNGLGYQKFHPDVPSPYLWAATTIYTSGKYTGDGRFDRQTRDRQLGCAAILKRLEQQGLFKWPG
jgi:lysozyme family protein